MRYGRTAAAVGAAALLGLEIACGGSPTSGGEKPPTRTAAITSTALVAGGEGVLTGTDLDLLPATIAVDGKDVVPTARSATEIRFAMPAGRGCEVDGRPVQITAGSVQHAGRLTVPGTLRIEVGETRLLPRDELATACLQLPAGTQSYVLTALNPALDEAPATDVLFTVRTVTESGVAAAAVSSRAARVAAAPAPRDVRFDITPGTDFYSAAPAAFDPAYATAQPGDTVRWIDFQSPLWYNDGNICRAPKSAVPTFGAVVAAVSSTGRTVIAYDERTRYRDQWSSSASRERLARLADIVERWTLPAVSEVYGADYEPVHGAGGRWWHIFRTGVSRPTVDLAELPRSMCPHYSEVAATLGPDDPLANDAQVEVVAGQLVHEYAHHAEDVVAVRRWGNAFGRGMPGWSAVGEVWAQTVQETAARIASGQTTGARYDALGAGVPYPDFYTTGYGERPDLSPWGGGRGPYDLGTRLLMFLRERWGDAPLGTARQRFYPQVLELPRYDFASMAALAGLDATTALDQWSLAEATDDLVDPAAAAARGLPQLRTWVPQDREPLPQVFRAGGAAYPLAVAHGSYAALYFLASGANAGHGISLTFTDLGTTPFIARITRLR